MTENVKLLLEQLKSKEYKKLRVNEEEKPIIFPIDFFGFNFGKNQKLIELDGNITPNYKRVMTKGLNAIAKEIEDKIAFCKDEDSLKYGQNMLEEINRCIEVSKEHSLLAKRMGKDDLGDTILKIIEKGANTFYEACVFMKLCIYFLRKSRATHLGLGRFDQYMYSFYLSDKSKGVSDEQIFETLEAFFISINFDTDLYAGVQVGDNGQSMTLGGFDIQGNSVYNELSQMCMEASLELNLIDPKINLRVGKETPDELYVLGTKLTKKGLGFPQYCNDDVVVPGLVKLGYDINDAIDYVTAACWEYIIPNCGMTYPTKPR